MHFMCKITDGFPFFLVEQTLIKQILKLNELQHFIFVMTRSSAKVRVL